jgi:hypothetical protein
LHYGDESVSVAIEEVGPEQWIEKVYKPDAHLGLARSYSVAGDNAKARAAYQDFLTLWKDADPDISVLKQAKAEFAKLP